MGDKCLETKTEDNFGDQFDAWSQNFGEQIGQLLIQTIITNTLYLKAPRKG